MSLGEIKLPNRVSDQSRTNTIINNIAPTNRTISNPYQISQEPIQSLTTL